MLGILGRKGVGKDLIADYLILRYKYHKIAFASPLKDGARALFGFSNEQVHGNLKEVIDPRWGIRPRQALQWLGTDIFRKQVRELLPSVQDHFWIISALSITSDKTVISDVRFLNEVRAIREKGGKIIKVIRKSHDYSEHDDSRRITCQTTSDHESEKGIDSIDEYDFLINNEGTIEDLYRKLDWIIEQI